MGILKNRYLILFSLLIMGTLPVQGLEWGYNRMIKKSLISEGNNYRLRNVIEKAQRGEEVTVVYIGGSITEGHKAVRSEDSYANLSFESFKEMFAPHNSGNIHFVNAGMSGTPSTLGMIRYKRDVLDLCPTPPDLVVVEFAVNDGDDPANGASYESLIKDILTDENNPAVVLLFAVFQSQWNLQERFIPVGEAYQLPMISIKDAVVPRLKKGKLEEDIFFADAFHPTNYGHKIMADCISYYFESVSKGKKSERDIEFPQTAVIGDQFTGIQMISPDKVPRGVTINPGSFTSTDINLGTFMYAPDKKTFPENWHKKRKTSNEPFTMTLTCKNLLLVYKKSTNSTFGDARIYVDGKEREYIIGSPAGAWDNPWTTILIDENEAEEHTITIQMAEDNSGDAFSLLAFGYTK